MERICDALMICEKALGTSQFKIWQIPGQSLYSNGIVAGTIQSTSENSGNNIIWEGSFLSLYAKFRKKFHHDQGHRDCGEKAQDEGSFPVCGDRATGYHYAATTCEQEDVRRKRNNQQALKTIAVPQSNSELPFAAGISE
ncbi:unnamed protein product [Dracunculus medinensis]|uniref:Nuclear receptor domain-containing protein n=1 Tax=Dracunculus medinensis TaxID=318479 RepID=A0A0N4UQS9_DRAME|nr:unnamed protein product [Dracunculus medinensis]